MTNKLYTKQEVKIPFGNNEVTIETGRLAKQANGAVLIKSGGTEVLCTVCSDPKVKDGQDWFPLTVDYTEKFYAAGKFLGGFLKREGRPSMQETLTSRLIDRPLRPSFPEGFMNDTFVQATVISYDPEHDPEVLASIGSAAALSLSNIPFNGPVGTCKVGRIGGKLVLNPSLAAFKESDMELLVSATSKAILMVEGEANELSEKDILEGIQFAHSHIKKFITEFSKFVEKVGKPKRAFVPTTPNAAFMQKIQAEFGAKARAALSVSDKLKRQDAVNALIDEVKTKVNEGPTNYGLTEKSDVGKEAFKGVDGLLYDLMRKDILVEGKRIAGRKLDEVRAIEVETGVLSRPHGSALFTRGETQVLSTTTIGSSLGDQMVDRITGLDYNKFYLHYSFPPFSVGEARGVRGVGRRELGHGNLAERAIKKVLPSQEEFAYTIRVTCDVLESNGSSSMGSVCSGSMSLMDAGVPIKKPVAGIAMGLVMEGDKYKILSDILGDEDHLGDMDFKVAGTKDGITAIQMDIKVGGITEQIMSDALVQAKAGRLHILGEMSKAITEHRSEFKEGVPRMQTLQIPKDKIGAFIGPGGKNIRAVQENNKVEIEVGEDGTIKILGTDPAVLVEVKKLIDLQINGPKVGEEFEGVVVTIKEYGAFVDIAQGVSGLVHVSEFANERVQDINQYVAEGDKIMVKVIDIDNFGRLKLSAKAAKPLEKKA